MDLVEIANATEQNEIRQFGKWMILLYEHSSVLRTFFVQRLYTVKKTQSKLREENRAALARGGWIGVHYDKVARFFVSASTGKPLAYQHFGRSSTSNISRR